MEGTSFTKHNLPPNVIPHKIAGFEKYKQHKYRHIKILPKEYQKAAKALKSFEKNKIPIESSINPESHDFVDKEAFFLAQKTLKRLDQIDYMLDKLEVLKKNKDLNPWIARVLVTEMIFCRHQYARSLAFDVETAKFFEESMRDMFVETITLFPHESDVIFPVYVRINVIAISIDDCIRAFFKEGWNLLPRSETYDDYLNDLKHLRAKDFMRDFHISELLIFPPGTVFYDHPGYLKGKFLLQDKGSCLSSFLLNPKPDSVVLDMGAAPGLKTNHLANIMNNEGLIIANDDHPLRSKYLRNLLELTNVKCVQPCEYDHFNIDENLANLEDIRYILIDPTCTYSGLFFKSKKNSSKVRLQRIRFKCTMLLRYCLQTFPNLKRLVYTTCSIYPEEGERVITDTLSELGNSYTLLNAKEMLWNEWKGLGDDCDYQYNQYECSENCLRTLPERDFTPGYFIAVFERNFDIPIPPYRRKYKKGSKAYYAEELEQIEVVKPSGKVFKTYIPKKKMENEKITANSPMQYKKDSIFTKVKTIIQHQNKLAKVANIKNKMNQSPENKYKYVSKEYKNKLQQTQKKSFTPQETSQALSQKQKEPLFSQKNPLPFSKMKPAVSSQPALVSYPILNKLKQVTKEQQFSPQLQSHFIQTNTQYLKKKEEPQYSQNYSQPKLQSQFSTSARHQQLGLVSYPIFNKLMSNQFYEDTEEDQYDTSRNQLYP